MDLIRVISIGDVEALELKCGWFIIISTCVLIAMIVDLVAGIKKAHQRGEARTSYGLRRTVDKALRYFSLLILCFMMDIIAHLVTPIPYFSIISGIYLVFTEIRSWYEKADQKEKSNAYMLAELLKNKDDLAKGVAELITKQMKENEIKP